MQSLGRLRGLVYLVVALSALILPVAQIASARPLAAQTEDGSSESGVVGNSYTSPNFGYSITWDRAWTVTDEQNGADGDSLTLSNDVSVVTLSGIEFPLDLQTCIDSFTQPFVDDEAVSDFGPRQTGDGPVGGEDDGRLWAVFDFTYTAEDSEPIDFSVYVDCRFIVEGESALIISSIVEGAAYESQVEPLQELLAGLSFAGATGTDGNDEESTPIADPGDTGDTTELDKFVQLSAGDIDTFWTREFPVISGGREYTPPAAVVSFDTDQQTDCGELAVMEVGPAYCQKDRTIYYDLEFAQIQVDNFGSASVIAVVLAHETGHHIQNLMQWKECEQTPCLDPTEMTSQEYELQADCFAGAWMADAETRGRLGSFDVETNIAQFALILGDRDTENTAEPGAHGKAARRVFEFLNGYYNGVTECLKISAASDPARNGGANANTNTGSEESQPTAEASDEPTVASDEPTETADEPTATADKPTRTSGADESIQIDEVYEIELRDATLTMKVTGTQVVDEISQQFQADGKYVIVLFSLSREADVAGPFTYESFVLVDSAGNEYTFDEAATDAILKTADTLPDGVDQAIEEGLTYRLAIAFDVPADAAGFVFGTSDGDFPVELDV